MNRLRLYLTPAAFGYGLIWTFLIVFVLFPLTRIFYDAFTNEAGGFTLANFLEFFTDSFYLRSFWKSMALGVITVFTTSVIGIAVAFLIVRYDFPYRNLFSYLTMLPMILPPLVGVLGFVFILGRAGTLNVLLMDWFGLEHPVNFMYGMQGVLLVETVHLFPLMTMSILDALAKVDPSLEEAAQGVGAKGWRRFRDITLPLTTPGYVSGALLVFIWTFADFLTPLVLGVQDLLAPQAYLNIVQCAVDRRIFRDGGSSSRALLVILQRSSCRSVAWTRSSDVATTESGLRLLESMPQRVRSSANAGSPVKRLVAVGVPPADVHLLRSRRR